MWLAVPVMASSVPSSHLQRGSVVGMAELCGGPAPGHCRAIVQAAEVTAQSTGTPRVAAHVAVRKARFALTLAVGRYTLRLVLPGSGLGALTKIVRIEPNRAVTVNMLVPIS